MSPDVCPNCGAAVPPSATACPECGADEQTGWSEEARYSGLNLPEDSPQFDHKDFAKREFGGEKILPRGMHWLWWLIAVFVLAALAFLWFG